MLPLPLSFASLKVFDIYISFSKYLSVSYNYIIYSSMILLEYILFYFLSLSFSLDAQTNALLICSLLHCFSYYYYIFRTSLSLSRFFFPSFLPFPLTTRYCMIKLENNYITLHEYSSNNSTIYFVAVYLIFF